MRISNQNSIAVAMCTLVALPLVIVGCCSGSSGSGGGNDPNREQALLNLASISRAASLYAQDYDQLLPTATTAAAAQSQLINYAGRDTSLFLDPINNRPFDWNSWLSGKSLASLGDPSKIVAWWDSDTSLASSRPVGLFNGRSKLATDAEWQALKITSHIP